MKYYLLRFSIESDDRLDLTKSQHETIVGALKNVYQCLAIEERYDFVTRAYYSFEAHLHELALSNLLQDKQSWSEFIETIMSANLELVNLLSVCRLYIDHVPHGLSKIFGSDSQEFASFKHASSEEYDRVLGYRVLYALRNYAQHCGLPIHGLKFFSAWDSANPSTKCSHGISLILSLDELRGERSFKRAVYSELESLGESVDLKKLIRQNFGSFATLHGKTRAALAKHLDGWIDEIDAARESFLAAHPGDSVGIRILEVEDNGEYVSKYTLSEEIVKRLRYLSDRNKTLSNFEFHYVTSEAEVDWAG